MQKPFNFVQYSLAYSAVFAAAAAIGFLCSCATVKKDMQAFAAEPNAVATVESLVSTALGLVDRAIAHADAGGMRVLVADPNGQQVERNTAAQLRAAKEALNAIEVPKPDS